jgi:membrane fusion protein (multidrug efflux system)
MVVGADNKAEQRPITVGQAMGDRWLVTSGLQPGDRLITEGLQRVQPGVALRPVPAGSPPTAAPRPPGGAPQGAGRP